MNRTLLQVVMEVLLLLVAVGAICVAVFGGFGKESQKTYGDCILAHMPGSTGPAVSDIRRACAEKFPKSHSAFDDVDWSARVTPTPTP